MRILYIHQHFTTPRGSSGTRSYEFATRLVKRGHQVTMVCGSFKAGATGLTSDVKRLVRRGKVDGVDVVEICIPYSNNLSFIKRSMAFMRFSLKACSLVLSERYDLLFATSTPLTVGIPGIVGKFFRRKPFVFEVRDLWPELPREMGVITNPIVLLGMSILEWASYRSADSCVALSPGIKSGIKKRAPDCPVSMIPNGSDVRLFDSSAHNGEGAVAYISGVNERDFVAVYTGAHGIANGLEAVLDAAEELRKRGRNDIKICFIGDGIRKPGLVADAQKRGLENCIFLNPIPKAQVAQLLSRVGAGIMPLANVPAFYFGTSPNKFFDYIAAGLPVVNNYPGWLAGLISENSCGIAVAPEDPVALAEALAELADNPDRAEQYGENARKLAVEEFNRDRLAERFIDHLELEAGVKGDGHGRADTEVLKVSNQ